MLFLLLRPFKLLIFFGSPTTKPAGKKKSTTTRKVSSDSSASDSPLNDPEVEDDADSDRERADTVSESPQPKSPGSQRGTPPSSVDIQAVPEGGWETDDDEPSAESGSEGKTSAKPIGKTVAHGSKHKPVRRKTTRKAPPASTSPAPEVADEVPVVPKRKAGPRPRSQPKRNTRSQAAKPSSSRLSDDMSVAAQETPVQSDAEDNMHEVQPVPITPMKKQPK